MQGQTVLRLIVARLFAINYFAIAAHELFTSNTDNIVLKASSVSNFATSVTLATINNVVVVFMTALMLITLILQYQTKLSMMTTLQHLN